MPDMGKRFSHHTNRENPLTPYFLIKVYMSKRVEVLSKSADPKNICLIYRCKNKKADLLKTNQLMNNVLEARLELARTFLPKGF